MSLLSGFPSSPPSNPSQSTFPSSVRPSRQNTVSTSEHIQNGLTSLNSTSEHQTSLLFLIKILRESRLPFLICNEDKTILGQGAQFAVYKDRLCTSHEGRVNIAAKQPKFGGALLESYSLSESHSKKHVHAIALEILALTDPDLRRHPNIATLLGWSVDNGWGLSPFTLVMDLASYDLDTFLKLSGLEDSADTKYALCVDVANGLDQIHDSGLLHGDLKPQNVLLFEEHGRFVAKVADFGLSVFGHRVSDEDFRLGGTPGWQSPEAETRIVVPLQYLARSERYSYGLLVWSVFLHSGNVPPRKSEIARQLLAKEEMEKNKGKLNPSLHSILLNVLQQCLEPDFLQRPRRLMNLLPDMTPPETSLAALFQETGLSQSNKRSHFNNLRDKYDPFNKQRYEEWEPEHLPRYFIDYALSEFSRVSDSIPDQWLFEMFLYLHNRGSGESNAAALELLNKAATRGYTPARSILPTIYRFHNMDLPEKVTQCLPDWIHSAVADGSILGMSDLRLLAPQLLADSVALFRSTGGYNQIYFDNWTIWDGGLEGLRSGWSPLHYLSAFGTVQELKEYLKNNRDYSINDTTDNGETALYLGSLRGSWEAVQELMRHGADPSIPCTSCGIMCLHWLFSFDEHILSEVVSGFLSHGASINAVVSEELPFYHYPFVLPRGTPLHWAIATSNVAAIAALHNHEADFHVRDGSDPYTFDRRVRCLDCVDSMDIDLYSIPEIETMGLSPLDLSAINYEPALFRLLVTQKQAGTAININAVDEEGFSVLHRLSPHPQRRTRLGLPFSYPPFIGSRDEYRERLRDITAIVKRIGGDFDLLTKTATCETQSYRSTLSNYGNRTPLMLAMMYGQIDVAEALLDYGADPNKENEVGETALELLYQVYEDCVLSDDIARRCVELLVARGADVNHHSSYGTSPLQKACNNGLPEAVDVLIVNGAAIIEPEEQSNELRDYSPLWSLSLKERPLPSAGRDSRLGFDQSVAKLLQRHVFSSANSAKIRRIVDGYDKSGTTMLFRFAKCGMYLSVGIMLQNGVDPNQPCLNRLYRSPDVVIYTALDVAIEQLESLKDNAAKRDGPYTREQFDALCDKYATVIEGLTRAGGVPSSTGETVAHPDMSSVVLPASLRDCLPKPRNPVARLIK